MISQRQMEPLCWKAKIHIQIPRISMEQKVLRCSAVKQIANLAQSDCENISIEQIKLFFPNRHYLQSKLFLWHFIPRRFWWWWWDLDAAGWNLWIINEIPWQLFSSASLAARMQHEGGSKRSKATNEKQRARKYHFLAFLSFYSVDHRRWSAHISLCSFSHHRL